MRTAPAPDVERETPDHEVLIVGAGFAGIGVAIELGRHGIDDVTIIDKWHAVGGTWLANRYPGVAVDIPSFVYSYSFAQRADWSRLFAPGAELQRYAEDVVDEYGLREKLRLRTRVAGAVWDEEQHLWRVGLEPGGEVTARYLVNAIGGLEQPKLPAIEGIEDFEGTIVHTALWPDDLDLGGKRIGVIGTGASALQLIPEVAKDAAQLTVFQRTPIWVAPKPDVDAGPLVRAMLSIGAVRRPLRAAGTVGTQAVFAGIFLTPQLARPFIAAAEHGLRRWMRSQVDDPEVLRKLTPQYMFGCKRPSISNAYLRTFNRPNVTLQTDPIARVEGSAVVTADGTSHEFDVLVCATGFSVLDEGKTPPYPVTGCDGLDLGTFWHEEGFQAYEGLSVPRFPNTFTVPGPYAFAPGSYFWMIEASATHIRRAMVEAAARSSTCVEVRQEPHDAYFELARSRARRSHLFTPRCAGSNTYYVDYQGEASALRPSLYAEMWWRARHFALDDYWFTSGPDPMAPQAPVLPAVAVGER